VNLPSALDVAGPTVLAIAGLSFVGWWIALRRTLDVVRERRLLKRGRAAAGEAGIVGRSFARIELVEGEHGGPSRAALDAWLGEERSRLASGAAVVATIAAVCPLLGLLGTLLGLMDTFGELAAGSVRPAALGRGVARALTTTEAGLLAALPLLVLHGLMESRAERLLGELDHALREATPDAEAAR
jgi:biopolymer transport protein ExbB